MDHHDKHSGASPRHHQVLSSLSRLPRKIVALHNTNYTAQFVLHEIALRDCFNLGKAAYFVDNPDFDCLRGVAGYDSQDHNGHTSWALHDFDDHLGSCRFNKKVRCIDQTSYKRAQKDEAALISVLARELSMHNPSCYVWDMKCDNQGVLVYEIIGNDAELQEHLQNGLHFLSLCPIL